MDKQREKQGIVVGIVGLVLNIMLGTMKLVGGIITASIAIVSDAINNLSDAVSSLATVISFFLVGKKADKEHPYGHGRYEYISAFVISIIILSVGIEFLEISIKRCIQPEKTSFTIFALVVLIVSIVVKFFMFIYFSVKSKKLKSPILKATSVDCLSDSLTSIVVLIGFIWGMYTSLPIDAICGILVSILIIINGVKLVGATISRLLGSSGDTELRHKIIDVVKRHTTVKGMHDLNIHDYGAERIIASVDLEFDEKMSMKQAHSIINEIERHVYNELNVELVIHCDPIDVTDENLVRIRHIIYDELEHYSHSSMHDLIIYYQEKDISFHLKLDDTGMKHKEAIVANIRHNIDEILPGFTYDVTYDFWYQ